jgi:hypothetical protein
LPQKTLIPRQTSFMSKKRKTQTYADPQQSKAFKHLFGEDAPKEILLHLLDTFLPLDSPLKSIQEKGDLFTDGYFRCKGCISDGVLIKAIDSQNRKILVHCTLLHLHRGITEIELIATDKLPFILDNQWKEPYPLSCYYLALADFDILGWESTQSILLGKSRTMDLNCGIFWVNLRSYLSDPSELVSIYSSKQQWAELLLCAHQTVEIPSFIKEKSILKAYKMLELSKWPKSDLDWYLNPETTLDFRLDRALKSYQQNEFALNTQYLTQSAPSASLKMGLLKKELGYYPVSYVTKKQLIVTAIKEKKSAVFPLFRYWSEQAKVATGIEITIVNEQNLLQDYENEIKTALLALFNSGDMVGQRYSKKWEIRTLTAILEARLEIQWHFDYILKQQTLFKKMQAMRAILGYLAASETTNIAIDDIYKKLLKETVNIENISGEIDLEKSGELIKLETGLYSHVPENLQNVIRNLMGEMIEQLSQQTQNTPQWLSSGKHIHDEDLFAKLIEQNWYLFFGN